ncbi:hypothetical protein TTHERM_000563949 (macronuclear) [Tetrahymena thermophila SB210]|uniref:Uncharacterized protein n=1 Tax=Tetrahymena thermophila (strain SB210) TaxID=312017 RepID=W7XHY1_TETTS|nr:hypothetical protein TTHERM_000563949 [Tetrahymena thermophila SB210]EWS72809.1 hypothetical protein TTHERM_000563949 [Tetrahymena thermophila SB210]|eukprot:XP_012654635.1 hypothetical protein TTHERM_000563949 [Tetrahymena thermophila SB210]
MLKRHESCLQNYKIFLEDIPQVVVVLTFNLRFSKTKNLLDWLNLRVIKLFIILLNKQVLVITVLSMYKINSLNSGWQDISEVYKIKISQDNQDIFTYLSIPKVISKTLFFNQQYKIKKDLQKGGSSSQKSKKKRIERQRCLKFQSAQQSDRQLKCSIRQQKCPIILKKYLSI